MRRRRHRLAEEEIGRSFQPPMQVQTSSSTAFMMQSSLGHLAEAPAL